MNAQRKHEVMSCYTGRALCRMFSVMGALPSMDRYLASLPNGLDSYPECQTKFSVLRTFVQPDESSALARVLPPKLAEVVRYPAPPSAWLFDVHATAIYLATADAITSPAAFVESAYNNNYALLDSAMYRVLFRLVGVKRMLSRSGENWATFHRGTTLSLRSFDAVGRKANLRLDAPSNLVPQLLADSYATGVRAAVEIAGGEAVSSVVTVHHSNYVDVSVTWR